MSPRPGHGPGAASDPEGAALRGPLRAVVFDFDGTLAEPVLDFARMRRELAELVRPYAPWARLAPELPVLEWLEALGGEADAREPGAGPALLAAVHERIRALEVEAAGHTRLFPFARALLAGLAARGVGTAVITRNCARALDTVFPDARAVVGAVLTRDDVARVKPDPGHLGAALAALGAAPASALMVGDHPLDVETGRRLGALTAGVLTGAGGRAALLAAGADFVLPDCAGLPGALALAGLLPPAPGGTPAPRPGVDSAAPRG